MFSKIAGCFTAAGLNILTAQIFTRTDGIILDTFFVIDAKTGAPAKREERDRFDGFLQEALTGHLDLAPLIARQKVATPLYKAWGEGLIPTLIRLDNDTSDYYTIIEVQTEDRVGLLYTISQTLSDLKLDISLAKICTEKGAAIDSFYVAQADSQKVRAREYLQSVEEQLKGAIAGLEGG